MWQSWYHTDTSWTNLSLTTYLNFNNLNLPEEELRELYQYPDYINLQNSFKRIYEYNNNGDITLETYHRWDSNQNIWDPSSKTTRTYSNQDQLLTLLEQNWEEGYWENNRKTTYEYNDIGYQIFWKQENWQDSEWILFYEYNFYYNDNNEYTHLYYTTFDTADSIYIDRRQTLINSWGSNPSSILSEILVDSVWHYDQLMNYYTNIDTTAIDSAYIFTWMDSSWVNSSKSIYGPLVTTSDNSMYYSHFSSYTWADSMWVGTYANNYTFNDNNQIESSISYNGMDLYGEWINNSRQLYTYDNNQKLYEHIYQSWDDEVWTNTSRYLKSYDILIGTDDILGDCNQDGNLDVLDIISIANHILEYISFNEYEALLADYDEDGEITTLDIIQVINSILRS